MLRLIELWNETADFTFGKKVWMGLLFTFLGAVIYAAGWFVTKGNIEEYGYPKWSNRRKRRRFAKYTFPDKLLLWSLRKHAVHRGAFLELV